MQIIIKIEGYEENEPIHNHEWVVYYTVLCPPLIGVRCFCGIRGFIPNFTQSEWNDAYYASENPYRYTGNNNIVIFPDQSVVIDGLSECAKCKYCDSCVECKGFKLGKDD